MGSLFFFIHWIALARALYDKSDTFLWVFWYILLIFYMALWPALWFTLFNYLKRYVGTLFGWLCATTCYLWLIETKSLQIFGVQGGYPMGNPIMILAIYPSTLFYLSTLTRYGLLLLVLLFSWAVTNKKMYAFLILIPFFVGPCLRQENRDPIYMNMLAAITPPPDKREPLRLSQEIAYKITRLTEVNQGGKIIFFPESSYPFCCTQDQIDTWCRADANQKSYIVIGSHRKEGKNKYNSIIFARKSRIIFCYDKIKLFPFIETNPTFLVPITPSAFAVNSSRIVIPITLKKNISLVPYICSDLFFSTHPVVPSSDKLISLFLVNDCCFSLEYMKDLMFYYAVFKTIEWRTQSIYIGYKRKSFINNLGFQSPLLSI